MSQTSGFVCDQCDATMEVPADQGNADYHIVWHLSATNFCAMGHNGLPYRRLDFCSPQCLAAWLARDDGKVHLVGQRGWAKAAAGHTTPDAQ